MVTALIVGANAERIFTSATPPWRGLVRVQFGPLPSYFGQPVPELVQSASDTFQHPRFSTELGLMGGLPHGDFIFVGARPYRETEMLELEFAGDSKFDVESLAMGAAKVWALHLATNQPPIKLEVVAINLIDERPAKGSLFRSRRWRGRRADSPH